jgi:hypothetical protein
MTSKIQMPFTGTGWPSIIAASSDTECRRPQEHRLYHTIGVKCSCGPIPLKVTEDNIAYELHIFAAIGAEYLRDVWYIYMKW